MTISATTRKAGPYDGDATTTEWPFAFKVFSAADVLVTRSEGNGLETVLVQDTDYTIALNANQETSPGGTVTCILLLGQRLAITGNTPYDQALDIPGGGNFNPIALENQLDRTTMQIQQLAEQIGRVNLTPVTGDPAVPPGSPFASYGQAFTSTADQTDFVCPFNVENAVWLEVLVGGVPQIAGTDYTATSTTVTFLSPLPADLVVYVRGLYYSA